MGEFGKKLGDLSLAVLENFVEKNLGKKFVDELRSPTDRVLAIQTALENVEDRFQKEFEDKDLYHSIFIGLPIDKTKLGETIGKFFDRPTDSDFPKILTQFLITEYKTVSQSRIDTAVSFYIKVLKQELALADDVFREKIKALTDLETLEYIKEISKNLKPPDTKSGTNLKKEAVNLPIYTQDSDVHPVGDLPLGSHLPFSPNALFTGREKELKKLADSILGESRKNTVITQAVVGMGGLGKTQLAIEFGYRYGKYFRGVHWLNLANTTQLDSEIANCGKGMFTQDFPEDQPTQVALTLKTWKENGPNLLILDNFEEPSKASDILTKLRHSNICILVTSRRMDWSQTLGLHQLPLDVFSEEESLQFLKDSLKDRKDSEEDLKNLAERLGHLPLGLELASRYLNGHTRLNISDYLKQTENALDHASMKNWRADMPAATGHDLDLQKTFALSWREIQNETAQKIFMMAGYLAPNTPIPLEIFERALEIKQEICDEALNLLYGLGLFKKGEDNLPTIHPLLTEYARALNFENKDLLVKLSEELSTLAREANDKVDQTGNLNWFVFLRPHVFSVSEFGERVEISETANLLGNLGNYLNIVADYKGAKSAHERALKIREAFFGLEHENVALSANNLGNVMKDLGDLNGAKKMYERAIKIWEANLGEEHPQVAIGVNNLGLVMKVLGDLNGARIMFEHAIKIWEANLGEEHPQVAIGVNNLGTVMKDLGDLNGAKKMYERALKIDDAGFGEHHPNVAGDVNNLGDVMQDLGDLNGAKKMYERAIKIWEANLGEEHPQVAIGVNNLGSVLQDLGDLNGAKKKYERALKIDEANFGLDHPKIAIRVNNLGLVMQDLGDLNGAKKMFERALVIFKKFLPADHPNIKIVQKNLDLLNKSK